jgi:quercetin dioxygenase-like cupin family protein
MAWALRLAAALAILSLATASVALATPGDKITTTIVARGLFEDIDVRTKADGHKVAIQTKGPSDVYVVSNVLGPGGHTGWHTHLGPSLITVTAGTITAYDGDDPTCSPMTYQVGEGFVDPGDGHVHILRNEGSADAATIAVQLLPQGAGRRIDVPAPGNCSF